MSELYRDFIEDQFDRVVNAINNELPTPLPADIGKVVQVVSDGGTGAEYALDAVPNELPTPTTSDINKVVKVVSDGGTGAEYSLDAVPNELPTPTTSDIGKFATVVSDGSGGAEYSLDNVVVPQELPTPASTNVGKVATVVSNGSGGYEWGAENIKTKQAILNMFGTPPSFVFPDGMTRSDFLIAENTSLRAIFASSDWSKNFDGVMFNKTYTLHDNINNNPALLIFTGIIREIYTNSLYEVTVTIGETSANDAVQYKPYSPT